MVIKCVVNDSMKSAFGLFLQDESQQQYSSDSMVNKNGMNEDKGKVIKQI